MIIGIGGWERCFKTGMAAILASHPEEFDSYLQAYNIKQGFGNLHLFETPYQWFYLESAQLVDTIREANLNHIRDTLFLIDEADSVYNPRDYTSKEQTKNLKGIGQHAKMGNVYIYTYQLGQPEDILLGVDKILRSNTRIELELRFYNKVSHRLIYKLINRLIPDMPPIEKELTNCDRYYKYWDHLEPVV